MLTRKSDKDVYFAGDVGPTMYEASKPVALD